MTIKQGTILPTTGIGVGYLLLMIYGIFAWQIGLEAMLQIPEFYSLPLIFSLMQFSYKDFILDERTPHQFKYRYRILFFIPIYVKHDFSNYNPYVLRVINKTYNVKQGAAAGLTVNEGSYSESYFAIVGRNLRSKNNDEICNGKKELLDEIIKKGILPLDIPVYLGAPKKGYEYDPN